MTDAERQESVADVLRDMCSLVGTSYNDDPMLLDFAIRIEAALAREQSDALAALDRVIAEMEAESARLIAASDPCAINDDWLAALRSVRDAIGGG